MERVVSWGENTLESHGLYRLRWWPGRSCDQTTTTSHLKLSRPRSPQATKKQRAQWLVASSNGSAIVHWWAKHSCREEWRKQQSTWLWPPNNISIWRAQSNMSPTISITTYFELTAIMSAPNSVSSMHVRVRVITFVTWSVRFWTIGLLNVCLGLYSVEGPWKGE